MEQTAQQKIKETVIFDGATYFAALLKDVDTAKHSVDLETYIFKLDSLGTKILKSLSQAAKRGVAVRVLVDGAGTTWWSDQYVTNFESSGGQSRIFHSFPWRLWQWSHSHVKGSILRKMIYLLSRINSRNHRKVCIIDKKIVYIGSFNISQELLHNHRREAAVRLQHYDFTDLLNAFDAAWSQRNIKERMRDFFRKLRKEPIIRLNNTWHRRHFLYKNLLRRIRHCKKRIWITNAYFVPDNLLMRRLVEAAHNGVDVRILLPQKSDVAFMPWASKVFYAKLLKSGVQLYEFVPGVLHAKTLILDEWMLIGSSNLNHRSILHDLEVDVNIRSLEAKQILEQQFLTDIAKSIKVKYEDWKKRPLHQRIIGKLVLYLKYLI